MHAGDKKTSYLEGTRSEVAGSGTDVGKPGGKSTRLLGSLVTMPPHCWWLWIFSSPFVMTEPLFLHPSSTGVLLHCQFLVLRLSDSNPLTSFCFFSFPEFSAVSSCRFNFFNIFNFIPLFFFPVITTRTQAYVISCLSHWKNLPLASVLSVILPTVQSPDCRQSFLNVILL